MTSRSQAAVYLPPLDEHPDFEGIALGEDGSQWQVCSWNRVYGHCLDEHSDAVLVRLYIGDERPAHQLALPPAEARRMAAALLAEAVNAEQNAAGSSPAF